MKRLVLSVVLAALTASGAGAGEVRYLSATGDDAADGRTPQSAWRTVEKLNAGLPAGGTALLRRGDVFYGGLRLPAGTDASHPTVLADYGTGPKPVLSSVKIIRPDPSVWQRSDHCRWRVNLADPTNCTGIVTEDCNPGFLLVDGEVKAWRRYCRDDVVSPWDFCGEDGWLHVHAPKNPALLAKDIRVALNVHGVVFRSHTVISNLAVRATGAHGMYGGWDADSICEDVHISDCDFENIGGSELPHYAKNTRVRYGNGVEFGSNCRSAVVERCTFKGTYDVAVTMQGYPTLTSWSDIHVRNCTMTDCTQAFEVWCGKTPKGYGFERCSFTGNRTLRVGGGWGPVVRPVRACATPLLVYGMETDKVDITVSGNTFEDAPWGLLFKSGGLDKMPAGYRIRDNVLRRVQGQPAGDGICPFVPYKFKMGGAVAAAADLRDISKRMGFRRFLLSGPGFDEVMYAPFAADLYAKMGAEMAEVKRLLSDTDIELGWWCAPSIRYVSGFASIEDASGNKSKDNKKCPLDPAFQSDWSAKVKSVAAAFRPAMICIEDDYTLAWGRGLNGCACFCPRHLASFAFRYGKALTGPEIAAAFASRTKENEPIRRAFAETVRASLAELAGRVRAAVDEVDPSIRIMLCESGACSDCDGDALETLARAFAGPRTRPCVRPSGAIYGAQTTPADIPPAVSHTMYTLERLPRDIETFYEADPYPHNRFFTSAAQMQSLMAGAMFMGSQNILLYCLQYLDDPLEDPGYAEAYRSMRPRLETVRSLVADRQARLAGVRVLWRSEDSYLTHGIGGGHGGQLADGAFLCAKMGLPYTTRTDAEGPVLMMGNVAETMSDDEIRLVLSGGVLLDAPAAALLQRRGFGAQLGAEVELAEGRLPVIGERLLPAAGLSCKGRAVNAFYILSAGTEGTVTAFATLRPQAGTEVWSEFTGVGGKLVTSSVVCATNSLGGRVAILATSLLGNRSSGLYNLRKQELLRNLFNRLAPGTIPVAAVGAPGIWTLAQLASDGKGMLVMVNNLSGDERRDVEFDFHRDWVGARVSRIDPDGTLKPLGLLTKRWKAPLAFGQMTPEFLVIEKKPALVLRFDDNKSPQQWQEIAEIFEAIGGRCSFAVNPAWLSEEQWAKLRELSARGHSFAYISHQWTKDRAKYLDQCRQLAAKLKAGGIRMTTYSHIAE